MAIISSRPRVGLLKTRWRIKAARTLADRAGVVGANVWKVSMELFRHMEKDGFRFGSDRMVAEVLTEFIAFMLQLVDRAVYARLSEADRAALLGEASRHLAATMENNLLDLLGPGEYRAAFIATLNQRFDDYAYFEYAGDAPGYGCLRFLAEKVAEAMASGDNKWVVEQVMEIEAPEMVRLAHELVDQVAPTADGASS